MTVSLPTNSGETRANPKYNRDSFKQRRERTRVSDAEDGHAVELTAGSPEVIVVWRKRQEARLGRGGQ